MQTFRLLRHCVAEGRERQPEPRRGGAHSDETEVGGREGGQGGGGGAGSTGREGGGGGEGAASRQGAGGKIPPTPPRARGGTPPAKQINYGTKSTLPEAYLCGQDSASEEQRRGSKRGCDLLLDLEQGGITRPT